MILPLQLAYGDLAAVLKEIRLRGEVTRYQVEKATGQHHIKEAEKKGFSSIYLRTLLTWCDACGFEVVIRPKTREARLDLKTLRE